MSSSSARRVLTGTGSVPTGLFCLSRSFRKSAIVLYGGASFQTSGSFQALATAPGVMFGGLTAVHSEPSNPDSRLTSPQDSCGYLVLPKTTFASALGTVPTTPDGRLGHIMSPIVNLSPTACLKPTKTFGEVLIAI